MSLVYYHIAKYAWRKGVVSYCSYNRICNARDFVLPSDFIIL